MTRIWLAWWAVLALACGPGEPPEVYAARGQVVQVAGDGSAVVVDHEKVPGYMDAMRMTLDVETPAEAVDLAPGTKIRFELVVEGTDARVRGISVLPADTELALNPGGGRR